MALPLEEWQRGVTARASLKRGGNWNRRKLEESGEGEEENERRWNRAEEEATDVTKVTAIWETHGDEAAVCYLSDDWRK